MQDSDFIMEDVSYQMNSDRNLKSPSVPVTEESIVKSPDTPVSLAVQTLIKALQEDIDFAWSYHCNIAMAFQDEGGDYKASNRAAARFMKNWADVDTTKSPRYFE